MSVLSQFAPDMEIYSIDEAFLNLNGISGDMEEYCRQIRARVKKWVGVPVSIGIGPSKTLVKAATRVAKKNKSFGDITGRSSTSQNTPLYGVFLQKKGIPEHLSIPWTVALAHISHLSTIRFCMCLITHSYCYNHSVLL